MPGSCCAVWLSLGVMLSEPHQGGCRGYLLQESLTNFVMLLLGLISLQTLQSLISLQSTWLGPRW